MLGPVLTKDDRKARIIIFTLSIIVFLAVAALGKIQVPVGGSFDVHIFAKFNAIINSIVSLLLLIALLAVMRRKFVLHRNIMLVAMVLSALFLISYICHHLFSGDTKFGGTGGIRIVYFIILISHIFLAAIILPFILFTAYRALIGEFEHHKRLARLTWPIWFYVSVTGVTVYLMISPYYK